MMNNDTPHPDRALIHRASDRRVSRVRTRKRLEKPLLFRSRTRRGGGGGPPPVSAGCSNLFRSVSDTFSGVIVRFHPGSSVSPEQNVYGTALEIIARLPRKHGARVCG